MAAENTEHGGKASRRNRHGMKAVAVIDKRRSNGKRYKALAATFRQRVGFDESNPDLVLATAIHRAAMLQVLAEDVAARAMKADPHISLDDVVRLARLSEIAVRRLRLDERKQPTPPSLSAYLQQRGES
jgi:hypothetical protein